MTVGIWGYGREGRAALDWLLRSGEDDVVIFDDRASALGEGRAGVRFSADFADLIRCDYCLVSPGVPHTDPRRGELIKAGVGLRTGTQLWMRDQHAQTIGVTGTKGKSTTAALIHHLLSANGFSNELAGNIGIPLLDVPVRPGSRFVVELSSYQCESLDQSPDLAVITQLAWDHVPAHGSVETYWLAKAKIFTESGRVLVCAQDTLDSLREVGVDTDQVDVRLAPPLLELPAGWPAVLSYPHNQVNAALALAAASEVGIEWPELLAAAATFTPLAHRLEPVATTARGLVWISDVLATTQESAIAALNTFSHHPITMIIGGQERGQPIGELAHRLVTLQHSGSVQVICMGETATRFAAQLEGAGVDRVHVVETLAEAVTLAARISDDRAAVLLSPAAPSYDQFRDFEAKSAALRQLLVHIQAS
jgi:UDP-N-acetylmuramoylalanine--D-glutamate ligase